MTQFIDEEFEGVISSVTKWGMYVELPNTVEGLVHVNDLTDDYYEFDEDNLALIGRRTKTMYKLGDVVKVVVVAASKEERTIDFQLVGMSKSRPKRSFKRIDTRGASGANDRRRDGKPKTSSSSNSRNNRNKNHLIVSMIIRNQKEKIIKVQKTFRIKKVIVKKI